MFSEKFQKEEPQPSIEAEEPTKIETNEDDKEVDKEVREKEEIKKVALITVSQIDLGIKALAGDLEKQEFEVGKFNLLKEGGYSDEELKEILEKIKEYDAVCVSVSDYRFKSAAEPLIREIKKKLDKPVILGGVHAMLDPEDCLNAGADAVCLGEGEHWLAELLKNWNKRMEGDNRNFVVKREDLQRVNELRETPFDREELEQLTPDFSYHNFWQIKDGKLIQLTPENVADFKHHQIGHKDTIVYASDRGCPHSCTYCYNRNLRELYLESARRQEKKISPYYRMKSVGKMIEELETLKEDNPQVRFLNLMNDNMAARSPEELEEFAELYKKRIGWPFYCMTSPQMIKEEADGRRKLEALISAGMKELNIGIQTNEKTNQEIFGRRQSDEEIIQLSKMLSEYCREDAIISHEGKIDIFYDFIIHNPFETEDDIRRTIEFIKKLEPPFDLVAHTLFVGRTTILRKMYERKKKEAEKSGGKVDVVVEDRIGESDYHDTEKFYDVLKNNRNFVINSIVEFMAGRHDKRMTGRIPRYAKDLLTLDTFRGVAAKYPDFENFFSGLIEKSGEEKLSANLLTERAVLEFFDTRKEIFRDLFFAMNSEHPIRYTNQTENY